MAPKRDLDTARQWGREILKTHELEEFTSSSEDAIVPVIDTTEVQADAQPRKMSISGIMNTAIQAGIIAPAGGGGSPIAAGSGIYITQSGDIQIINSTVVSASGISIGAGSGIYLTQGGSVVNINYQEVYDEVVSGHFLGDGSVTVTYSGDFVLVSGTDTQGVAGNSITVSGSPGDDYENGDLWFDTNEGRLFVYASGGSVSEPSWYQTNAEAIALKSETTPSGTGENAPPRDGSIWFNTLTGSLFIYDITTSGWYETGPERSFAYGSAAPAASVQGAGWFDSTANSLKVWLDRDWETENQ